MKQELNAVWLGAGTVFAVALLASAASVQSRTSDAWITAKTKVSLAADGRVQGRQVSVETEDGQVFLRGKVDTAEAKAAASELAGGVDNVVGVNNELQVVAPKIRASVEEKDDVIVARVKKAFNKDAALRKAGIDVVSNAGVVSLTGEAPDFVTSAKASWEAWKVSGVKSVRNDLRTR